MEEKQGVKRSLLIFLVILIIVVIAFFAYKLYSSKESQSTATGNSENSNMQGDIYNQNETQNTNKAESLNIEDELVKKLYNYVEKFSYYEELTAYQSNKVTEKDMSNKLKLLTIFDNLDEKDATRIEYKYENEYVPKREHIIYSKNVIENKAKEIFGENVVITHEDASPYDSYSIIYKNDEYDCFEYDGGGAVPWEGSPNCLISAEKSDDGTISIYDKYVHLEKITDIGEDGTNHRGSYNIYSSTDKKEKLDSNVDFDKNNIYNGLKNISSEDVNYNKIYIQNIEKYLGKEVTTYKHTYKQNSDGTYYWYSTEPIK